MAVSCDPTDLAFLSSCFCGLSPKSLRAVSIYLLCQIANGDNPPPDPPAAPTEGDISPSSVNANLIITWDQDSAPDNNEVWRSKNGAAYALLATVAGAVTTYTDTDATMATNDEWAYKVRATNTGGESAFTTPCSVLKNYTKTVNTGQAVFSFPDVVFILGNFHVASQAALTTLSFPRAHTLRGFMIISTSPLLSTITFTALRIVVSGITISDLAATTLSFPALISAVGIVIQNNLVLSSFLVPSLQTVGGNFNFDQTAIVNFTAPSLVTVDQTITGNNLALVSISFPVLVTLGEDMVIHNAPLFTSLSIPVIIFTNGANIDLVLNALDDTSINQVLARGVASGVDSCNFQMNGGTSSSPTGQGIVDKGILLGLGNTVDTN